MRKFTTTNLFSLCALCIFSNIILAATWSGDVEQLRHEWAVTKYETAKGQQEEAYKKLIAHGEALNKKYPQEPAVMIWYATALSSYAQSKGGVSMLPTVKKSRELLETALARDATAEHGFGEGVLGTLYARVPGWPIGFGSKEKARMHLLKAIQQDPQGIDANYYYGDFLVNMGEFEEAKKYLNIAQSVAIRPGYEVQDKGRKEEVAASIAKLQRLHKN